MECPAPFLESGFLGWDFGERQPEVIETVFWWRDTNKNSKFDVKGGA